MELIIGKKQEYINPNYEIEENILKEFIKNFDYELSIVHNSSDYTTLQYHNVDILRLKYGQSSKWVKIFIVPKYKNKYIDDTLFSEETKKTQLFWKSKIFTIEDINKFTDIVKEDIEFRNEVD